MKNLFSAIIFAVFFVIAPGIRAQDGGVVLPTKENFYLVLLIGQSNMAGRGVIDPADNAPMEQVFMLKQDGQWAPAVDPVHYDKRAAGVGLARSFAARMAAEHPQASIGLIPAACGGSSIRHWRRGAFWEQTQSHPYDDAIARAKRAMQDGVLKAILFHQGEADCGKESSLKYQERLSELVKNIREELDAQQVPFIIGQLSQWSPWNEGRKTVDAAQQAVAKELQPAAFASSEGLTSNPDRVHFDTQSLKIFGTRYYEAFKQSQK
jgi:hypothetical protein